jgi:predicted TIM-barrel fold metal-dependent hydrolase
VNRNKRTPHDSAGWFTNIAELLHDRNKRTPQGVNHLVFGTDFPYTDDFRAEETIRSIDTYPGFGSTEKNKVFFENAARVFPRLPTHRTRFALADDWRPM